MSFLSALVTAVIAVVALCVLCLAIITPYLDGRNGRHYDKWSRANALAWACYKRGKSDAIRRRELLYARYMARKEHK